MSVKNIKRIGAFAMACIMSFSVMTACSKNKNEDTSAGYTFETEKKSVHIDSGSYSTYLEHLIKFNYKEVKYEDWLSYKSPYDEYVPLVYDDHSGKYDISQTVAFAIRYAYENDIEYIEFPIEYGTENIQDGWEYACLSFADIPLAQTGCEITPTEQGYYRIRLSDTVRENASKSDEVIKQAKEIIDAMPADCKDDVDKAYYLYDWVCKNVGYDIFHAENTGAVNNTPQSIYGALIEKRAVCDGIASAVQLLFNMVGIECGKVSSLSSSSSHVWNYAKINDEIWDFDATWDIKRCYESEGNEITTEDSEVSSYQWFGIERARHNTSLSLTDFCALSTPETSDIYSEKSPCMKIYDYVFSFDKSNSKTVIYCDGKKMYLKNKTITSLYSSIQQNLDKKAQILIKFNNLNDLITFWTNANTSGNLQFDVQKSGYSADLCSVLLIKK